MGWFRRDGADLILQVQVRASAKSDTIAGVINNRLKIRLTAPPIDGRANDRLVAYLADLFNVPQRHVVLERGASSKLKQLRIRSPQKLPENLDWILK